ALRRAARIGRRAGVHASAAAGCGGGGPGCARAGRGAGRSPPCERRVPARARRVDRLWLRDDVGGPALPPLGGGCRSLRRAEQCGARLRRRRAHRPRRRGGRDRPPSRGPPAGAATCPPARPLTLARRLGTPALVFGAVVNFLAYPLAPCHVDEHVQVAREFAGLMGDGVPPARLARVRYFCALVALDEGDRDEAERLWAEV